MESRERCSPPLHRLIQFKLEGVGELRLVSLSRTTSLYGTSSRHLHRWYDSSRSDADTEDQYHDA